MTKANKFEINMNKLDNVSGGSLVSDNPLMQLAFELERPTKAVLESYSDSKARLINPREW